MAETVGEGTVQVIGPLLVAVNDGLQVSTEILVVDVAVHPLSGWVTTTV